MLLSSKLIQLIEDHWDPITNGIIKEIQRNPRLRHIGALPEGELRDRARDILEHLGHWLSGPHEDELARRFQAIGAARFTDAIPLAEVVLAYIVVKTRLIDYVRGQGLVQNPVALYAEEELQHTVGRFFDSIIYHVVCGYEEARPKAAQAKAGR